MTGIAIMLSLSQSLAWESPLQGNAPQHPVQFFDQELVNFVPEMTCDLAF
jgi:hypothetical protein